VLLVSVTAVGYEPGGARFVTRRGAKPRDLVAVTGELGGSEAGRRLLDAGDAEPAELIRRHLRPRPLLEAGRGLAAAGVTAMIDLSDGLATDAQHVAERSGVELRIRLDELPRAQGVSGEQAATGGDDYELLVTVPPARREATEATVPLTWIGEASAGRGLLLLGPDGPVSGLRGYEHP
jgi:thiamine-monophosphate kinase